ncbi:DUF5675 family protein [Roseibium sp. SCP14]|uniref:DUF5675 family protein n=1 Tax=Roseibium sp. SCP14 TaxID=3141375 RepID=UPI00333D19B9
MQTSVVLLSVRQVVILISAMILLSTESNIVNATDDFRIKIERKHSNEECTSGYLAVNGEVIAYTLELPWQNNEPLISSIPPGTYSAHLRYDKSDKWRLQLDNVPGRDGIQLHIGNYTGEIEGCILVGNGISDDLCTLNGSADAYAKLKNAFYGTPDPNSTPNKNISIEIVR